MFTVRCSRQCGHSVGPSLDNREDCVVLIGTDADLVTGEGHVVGLPGGVVTPQGNGIGLPLLVIHRVAAHGRGHLGIAKDLGLHGAEGCGSRGTYGHGPDSLPVVILVDDAGVIALPGLGDRVHGHTAHFVGGAPEWIGADHRVHDSRECGCIRKRGGQFTNGTLGDALFDKVCHVADTPALN